MKKYLYIFSVLGGIIYGLKKYHIVLPRIINNYVNDFLIVPIVLMISLFIVRRFQNNTAYTFPIGMILYVSIMYSVIFEYILPKYHTRYTADFIDILLYFFGGFVFWVLQKNEKLSSSKRSE